MLAQQVVESRQAPPDSTRTPPMRLTTLTTRAAAATRVVSWFNPRIFTPLPRIDSPEFGSNAPYDYLACRSAPPLHADSPIRKCIPETAGPRKRLLASHLSARISASAFSSIFVSGGSLADAFDLSQAPSFRRSSSIPSAVWDQHDISIANGADDRAMAGAGIRQWSAAALADTNDEHRVIADTWPRRAVAGIQQMHINDDARRVVAERLFQLPADWRPPLRFSAIRRETSNRALVDFRTSSTRKQQGPLARSLLQSVRFWTEPRVLVALFANAFPKE